MSSSIKTRLLYIISLLVLCNCASQPEKNEVQRADSLPSKIIVRLFHESGKLKAVAECTQDSVPDGKTLWYEDTTGLLVWEENYKRGKRNGVWKNYFGSGKLATEDTYKDDSLVLHKEFMDGELTFQSPIDISSIGKLEIVFNNKVEQFFKSGQNDTIEIKADNLPILNKSIGFLGAKARPLDGDKYIIYDVEKRKKVVKIFVWLKQGDSLRTKLDSAIIPVK